MVQLADILRTAEELWPRAGAEEWDAVGLVAGDPGDEVSRVKLAVDAVQATATEAVKSGAQLLIVHHPLLMRGVTSVAANRYKGAVLTTLIRNGCALLAAHTNADVVDEGTSAALSARLDLVDAQPITAARNDIGGIGRVGTLREPTSLRELAHRLASIMPATAGGIRVAGDADTDVRTVAVCGGAGDSLLAHPRVAASDVYITSDLRHHPASEAREQALLTGGPALIDVSHWASESLWLDHAAAQLRERHPELDIQVSTIRTDPWDFLVTH